jgi:hypothetical protein
MLSQPSSWISILRQVAIRCSYDFQPSMISLVWAHIFRSQNGELYCRVSCQPYTGMKNINAGTSFAPKRGKIVQWLCYPLRHRCLCLTSIMKLGPVSVPYLFNPCLLPDDNTGLWNKSLAAPHALLTLFPGITCMRDQHGAFLRPSARGRARNCGRAFFNKKVVFARRSWRWTTMFRMFFLLIIQLCLVPAQYQNMSRDVLRGRKIKGMCFCCSANIVFFLCKI